MTLSIHVRAALCAFALIVVSAAATSVSKTAARAPPVAVAVKTTVPTPYASFEFDSLKWSAIPQQPQQTLPLLMVQLVDQYGATRQGIAYFNSPAVGNSEQYLDVLDVAVQTSGQAIALLQQLRGATSSFTLEMYMLAVQTNGSLRPVSYIGIAGKDPSSSMLWQWQFDYRSTSNGTNNGLICYNGQVASGCSFDNSFTINTDVWTHWVASVTSTSVIIYRDGLLVMQYDFSGGMGSIPLDFFTLGDQGTSNVFALDFFRLYNGTALDAAQAFQLYQNAQATAHVKTVRSTSNKQDSLVTEH